MSLSSRPRLPSRHRLAVLAGLDTDDPDDDGTIRILLRSSTPLTLRPPVGDGALAARLLLALIWLGAILLDAATTWVALQGPFRERNPLPAYLMGELGVTPVLLLGSLLCGGLALLSWSRGGPELLRAVRVGLGIVAVLKLGVALHNLHLLS